MSADRSTSTSTARDGAELAPTWHTAVLVVVILAVAITGALLANRGAAVVAPTSVSSRIAAIYAPIVVVQWTLAIYVCRIGRARNAFASLLGERWTSVARAAVDIAIASAVWALVVAFAYAWARAFAATNASVATLLPHTVEERLGWVAVSLSAGVCEELVYRGYLETQLGAFTKRASLGVILQALLFGIAHAEQGMGSVVRSSLIGVAFGAVARWRRSLLPGMVAHVAIDLASGLLHG